MPAASLQSRINAFESLGQQFPPPRHTKSPSKPSSNLLEAPISPTASSFTSIAPYKVPQSISRSPSPSPPILGRKASLIDLRDWVVDDGPSPNLPNGFEVHMSGKLNGKTDFRGPPFQAAVHNVQNHIVKPNSSTSILIDLGSSPKPKPIKAPPPLPPRKASFNSLESVSSSNSSQTRNSSTTSFMSSRRPNKLTVEHTYPPVPKHEAPEHPRRGSHVPASSVSSFHSVSLSSDGGITDSGTPGSLNNHIATFPTNRNDADTLSLDDSFEDVSTSSIVSPTTAASFAINWESKRSLEPPKLPQRPPPKPARLPASVPSSPKTPTRPSSTSPARRGPPPPPPPRPGSVRTSLISTTASDRSSILSTGTATTSRTSMSSAPALMHKLSVPFAARKRYENVFVANVRQRRRQVATMNSTTLSPSAVRKTRQAAGWRGLSVDLITNHQDHPFKGRDNGTLGDGSADEDDDAVGPEEKLDGYIVKLIWCTSKLEREKLRSIWNECDISHDGALDREAFVKGMWRIDEELRKVQSKSWSSPNGALHLRPHSKQTAAKPILR